MNGILRLFEGLTPAQAKELTRRIVPALQAVKAQVIRETMTAAKSSDVKVTRGKSDEMHSDNDQREAV
jgi:hypothetical protein